MDKFNEAGHGDMMMAEISTELGRKQKEGGTKALATAEKKVFSDGRDDGDIRS